MWERAVSQRARHPFLTFESSVGDTAIWTYEQFDELVTRVGHWLSDRGVEKGSSVHLALANCPAFVAVWLAVTRLGGWIIPSDPMGSSDELAGHIRRTRPVIGVCAVPRAEVYRSACGSLSVVEVDESDTHLSVFGKEALARWPEPGFTDRAAVMFTSGTTGVPKGVEVTQANYAFAGQTMAHAAALNEDDRQLVVLPLFHANAQYYSFASAICVGASVVLTSSFSASRFLPQAARHGATAASLFAAPLRMILARGAPVDGVRLRHCWFAQNLTNDQYRTVVDWFGCRPRQLYGMTETIPAVLTDGVEDPDPSSMGQVTPGCQVDVQRPDGTSVDPGEVGEVVVGGERGITLFAGYLNDHMTTQTSFRHGWFLTGDRATRDPNGRHYFDGRRSDVLKVAGESVSIVEVESVLSDHPKVLEAAVVGQPDPIRDEVPVAFVVAAPGGNLPTLEELETWCNARLAKAKRPRQITIIEELPRTSVGKIRKFILADKAAKAAKAAPA